MKPLCSLQRHFWLEIHRFATVFLPLACSRRSAAGGRGWDTGFGRVQAPTAQLSRVPWHGMVPVLRHRRAQRSGQRRGTEVRHGLDVAVVQQSHPAGEQVGGPVLHAGLEQPVPGQLHDAAGLPVMGNVSQCVNTSVEECLHLSSQRLTFIETRIHSLS